MPVFDDSSNQQTMSATGDGVTGLGLPQSTGLVAVLQLVRQQARGTAAEAEIANLVDELEDSETYFGAAVNATDKRLNGVGAWSIQTGQDSSSTAYTLDVTAVDQLADSVIKLLTRYFYEINRRINAIVGLSVVLGASTIDGKEDLMLRLLAGMRDGVLVAAVGGQLTTKPVAQFETAGQR